MHIGFICNEYPPGQHGGIGTLTQTLGRALIQHGHQVTVVGIYRSPNRIEDDQGVTVVRIAQTPWRKMGVVLNGRQLQKTLAALHNKRPFDVLDGPELSYSLLQSNFPCAKIIRMNGGHHFFATTLGRKPHVWRSFLERLSFRRADHFCAVSRYVGETTRELLRMGSVPITILPNPVDTHYFRPHKEITEQNNLITFVGTLCEKKGIRQLVLAMEQIVAAVPNANLMAMGRDWRDPKTGESFQAFLETLIPPALKPHIEFRGHIENAELPRLLASSSIAVYPSHMEALPVAWIEGLAMGKAVVASRIGPGPEVIEEGISGLLCDPHDPRSIAESVITLLRDKPMRERLGRNARQRAEDCFDIHQLVQRNIEFYRQCIG